jgi:hypothetical protein
MAATTGTRIDCIKKKNYEDKKQCKEERKYVEGSLHSRRRK